VNKRRFIKGCYMDRGIDFDDTIGVLDLGGVCARIWQETVIWAVLDIMVNLVINVSCRKNASIYSVLPLNYMIRPCSSTSCTGAELIIIVSAMIRPPSRPYTLPQRHSTTLVLKTSSK
jgi:hypothetical protein